MRVWVIVLIALFLCPEFANSESTNSTTSITNAPTVAKAKPKKKKKAKKKPKPYDMSKLDGVE